MILGNHLSHGTQVLSKFYKRYLSLSFFWHILLKKKKGRKKKKKLNVWQIIQTCLLQPQEKEQNVRGRHMIKTVFHILHQEGRMSQGQAAIRIQR